MSQDIQANFSTLILSIAHSAKIGLGDVEHPESKNIQKNLEIAQYNIDLLTLLQKKTENNLDELESKLLTNMIGSLQMSFVKQQSDQKK